jgi:tRNA-modifying protein YgfZ
MIHRTEQYRVLRFSGVDAQAFLQSQLTNDVAALAIGVWQWQGYCTAKGRLQATFALTRTAADTFEAVVPVSTIEALAKRLTMFRMRSKLTIEIASDRSVVLTDSTAQALTATAATLKLPDGRAILLTTQNDAANVSAADVSAWEAWQLANINARLPEITAATNEMFVPQMIGWDTVAPGGGVSFSKGCYPGQEIVARAHYRGAVKRHLERVEYALADQETVPQPGATITLADGRTVEVCNSVLHNGSVVALIVA